MNGSKWGCLSLGKQKKGTFLFILVIRGFLAYVLFFDLIFVT